MTKPLSPQTDSFPLAWEGDDALDRERFDKENAADKSCPNFIGRYIQCVATLDWQSLAKPDATVGLYWFRPITGMRLVRLQDVRGEVERSAYAFRMALAKTENLPDHTFDRKRDPEAQRLGEMITEESCFAAFDESVVIQLGQLVLLRSESLRPPS